MQKPSLPLKCGQLIAEFSPDRTGLPARIELFKGSKDLTVGKSIACDVPFPTLEGLSPQHCCIQTFATDQNTVEVSISDVGSRQGTWLNDRRMASGHKHKLSKGDIISFGGRAEKAVLKLRFLPYDLRSIYARYDFGKLLGEGGFAQVRALRERETGNVFAVKVLSYSKLQTRKQIDKVKTEVDILRQLDHRNIIKFEGVFREPGFVFIVMEQTKHGVLRDLIRSRDGLDDRDAAKITSQILSALQYLHFHRISHRDIKATNVLMASIDPPTAKLCDFGLAKRWTSDNDNNNWMQSVVGTVPYMAPELFHDETGYDQRVDIYSVGVTTFMMLANDYPFDLSPTTKEPLGEIRKKAIDWNKLPVRVNCHARDFLAQLLHPEPAERASINAAYLHRWLKGYSTY